MRVKAPYDEVLDPEVVRDRLVAGETLTRIAEEVGGTEQGLSKWCEGKGILPKGRGPSNSVQTVLAGPGSGSHEGDAMLAQQALGTLKSLGVDARTLAALRGRILPEAGKPQKVLGDRETIEEMKRARSRALHFLDDVSLAKANAKDLTQITTWLTQQIQLLSGQPTAILSIDDRRSLHELGQTLVGELGRRGIEIDVTADAVEVIDG